MTASPPVPCRRPRTVDYAGTGDTRGRSRHLVPPLLAVVRPSLLMKPVPALLQTDQRDRGVEQLLVGSLPICELPELGPAAAASTPPAPVAPARPADDRPRHRAASPSGAPPRRGRAHSLAQKRRESTVRTGGIVGGSSDLAEDRGVGVRSSLSSTDAPDGRSCAACRIACVPDPVHGGHWTQRAFGRCWHRALPLS